MVMLLLKNHLGATFQHQFQYSLTIKVFCNVDEFDTTAILQIYHSEQKLRNNIFHIPTCGKNLRILSIAVHVHVINKQCNQTSIIDHVKNNCGQSQTAWYLVLVTRLWDSSH